MNRSPMLPAVCRVCGDPHVVAPLPVVSSHTSQPCCGDAHCRQVLERGEDMDPHAFEVYLAMQVRATRGRRAQSARKLAARLHQTMDDARGFEAIGSQLATQTRCAPEQIWRVVLPSGPLQSAPLPRERRRRYLAHLLRIIRDAERLPSDSLVGVRAAEIAASTGQDGTLAAHLCAVCRGGCCTEGADHGYLQPDSIQRFLTLHPGLTVRQILRTYLRYLPKVSMVAGCVNQTVTGCALPRELRSTGCNQFVCPPMAAAQKRESGDPPLQVMWVLQRRLDHWQQQRSLEHNPIVGAALVQPHGFVRLDWGTLAPAPEAP
jgi:hypothetical protein